MSSSNATRFLNDGATEYGLLNTQFLGLVTLAFQKATKFYDARGQIMQTKSISVGQSHSFYIEGADPEAEHHTPGNELLGQSYSFDKGTITVDDILVSHFDVPIDQASLSDFNVLQRLANKVGRALALNLDIKSAIMGFQAALTAALSGYHNGGNIVDRVGASGLSSAYAMSSTGSGYFRTDAAELARLMDEDNVPEEDRYLFISPYIAQVLEQETAIFSRDYQPDGTNNLNGRVIGMLEGFKVIKTNNLPSSNVTSYSGNQSKYNGDYRYNGTSGEAAALAFCGATEMNAALGYLQAGPIHTVIMPDERRNTTFIKGQIACGMGVLSPYCAGAITCTAS